MHRESDELRAALERVRIADEEARDGPSDAWSYGVPASFGVAKAPAFVATRTSDFRRIPDGAVLVTTMPRPELARSLSHVAAIFAERDGMLSHAAIVARELRVPCVVGVAGATRKVKTGMGLVVDGTRGTVERADARQTGSVGTISG